MKGQNNDIIPERRVTYLMFVRRFVLNQKTAMNLSVQGKGQKDQKYQNKASFFCASYFSACVSKLLLYL